MEILGSFLDEEWESLSQIFSGENPNFLLHCDGGGLFPATAETPSPTISPSDHAFPTNFFSDSQENSNTSEIDESLYFNIQENQDQQQFFFDHTTFDSINYDVIEEFLHLKGEDRAAENGDHRNEMQMKRKVEELDIEIKAHDDNSEDYSSQTPNKKPRNSRNAQKSRESQSKKSKKKIEDKNNEEERGNCISYSSEDDSNASQEKNPESKKSASSSKTRASRGSATDPQSLYARKRRERINERLRILQNLVPNGTKVDISTMLEEAVQYVKFLQLQIKLLSSDNMWMYAPLAYNGMDIGVYQNICPNLSP